MLTSATPACINGILGDAPSRFENLLDGLTSAGLRGVEAGIRAGDGTPLIHFNGDTDKPALLVKTHGSGNVVYLNLGVTKYGFSPPDGREDRTMQRPRKDWSIQQLRTGLQAKATTSALYTDERQNPGSPSAKNLRKLTLNLLELGGVRPLVQVTQGHSNTAAAHDDRESVYKDVYNYEKSVSQK